MKISPQVFVQADSYPIALVVKSHDADNAAAIHNYYLKYLEDAGLSTDSLAIYPAYYPLNNPKRVTAKDAKAWVAEFLTHVKEQKIEIIYCADATYFKLLTKLPKADAYLGYVMPCSAEGFEDVSVIYGINYRSIIYNPLNHPKLNQSLEALVKHHNGETNQFSETILKNTRYLDRDDLEGIQGVLTSLREVPTLACDIEGFSLKHYKAGIATIGFAVNATDGVVIECDYEALAEPDGPLHGKQSG